MFELARAFAGRWVAHNAYGRRHGAALRSPAADLNFTIALALIAVTFANALGVAASALKGRLKTFFNFSNPIAFFVGILELISEFAKIISFSFRLFGNVFAGEVLLTIIAFLLPYLAPLPFMFLEIFVGFHPGVHLQHADARVRFHGDLGTTRRTSGASRNIDTNIESTIKKVAFHLTFITIHHGC